MVEIGEYLAMTERPSGPPAMYQRWRSLVFLHFACPPEEIQALLPPGLTVDTFPDETGEEKAWVGLVPFRMEGIRPRGLPTVPKLSAFPETNVRTYVHHKGRAPGVWFFSLDAASATACRVARRFFALPYHEAAMSVLEAGDRREFESRRWSDDAMVKLHAELGPSQGTAPVGSLEFFLLERYLLYAYRKGTLFSGHVSHQPYPMREARVGNVDETLVQQARIQPRPFIHAIASEGVDVEVFALKRVEAAKRQAVMR